VLGLQVEILLPLLPHLLRNLLLHLCENGPDGLGDLLL
jgi:hypothetical protein